MSLTYEKSNPDFPLMLILVKICMTRLFWRIAHLVLYLHAEPKRKHLGKLLKNGVHKLISSRDLNYKVWTLLNNNFSSFI